MELNKYIEHTLLKQNATRDEVKGFFTSQYDMEEMRQVNRNSIYCDGIENVTEGCLLYTDELIQKVKIRFNVEIPKRVHLSEADTVADLLIEKIINPNIDRCDSLILWLNRWNLNLVYNFQNIVTISDLEPCLIYPIVWVYTSEVIIQRS